MKRFVVVLMVLVLLLSGCATGGPGGPTREINAVLDQYIAAYKAKDAGAVADLYSYPTKQIDADGREKTIQSRDEMTGALVLAFIFMEVHDMQIINRTVNLSGNTAVVTATIILDGRIFGTRTRTTGEMEFTMANDGGWKINVERTLSTSSSPGP